MTDNKRIEMVKDYLNHMSPQQARDLDINTDIKVSKNLAKFDR